MTLPSEQHPGATPSGVGVAIGTLVARVRFWAPVWVPLAVFTQIALLGLRPALAEKRRLDDAHSELLDTEHTLSEHADELERELRAANDPIYRERVRRAERDPLPVDAVDTVGAAGVAAGAGTSVPPGN